MLSLSKTRLKCLLDGVYITPEAELGLCKQTTPPDGKWEEGIKSALRSKPRYIYLGEIRSPDVASEALRAATSGHPGLVDHSL